MKDRKNICPKCGNRKEEKREYYLTHLAEIRKYSKEYYARNKNHILESNKKWREANIDIRKEYLLKYEATHKKERKIKGMNYRKNNPEKIVYYENKYIKQWEGFIPLATRCQICGKEIYFNRKNSILAIHFDHRQECTIKINPTAWLKQHERNPSNEKIFKDCNFGMLCKNCNKNLPTYNRQDYVRNVFNYVFGSNECQKKEKNSFVPVADLNF